MNRLSALPLVGLAAALGFVSLPRLSAQMPLFHFRGEAQGACFGSSVAAGGDVDRDGFANFIVGSPQHARNGPDAGAIQVFSGRTFQLLYTSHGDGKGDLYGTSIGPAGDLNRDGHADFIVGAPENSADPVAVYGRGYVRTFSGKDGAVLKTMGPYITTCTRHTNIFLAYGDSIQVGTPETCIADRMPRGEELVVRRQASVSPYPRRGAVRSLAMTRVADTSTDAREGEAVVARFCAATICPSHWGVKGRDE